MTALLSRVLDAVGVAASSPPWRAPWWWAAWGIAAGLGVALLALTATQNDGPRPPAPR